ncbi:MAG: DUF885 family protein, partial [Deltaproteobacteria bacterium]|nr:DUF885 family protein [Deltaproteobacteria bacterium]
MQDKITQSRNPLKGLAGDYFQYVAGCFPIMCASDEFHWVPRAQAAARYPNRIDDLSRAAVEECVDTLRRFQKEAQDLARTQKDLERRMDLGLLVSSISALLMDLTTRASWRHNPLLYLKIAFIGLEQAVTANPSTAGVWRDSIVARLHGMEGLFAQAMNNLNDVPAHHLQSALAMMRDGNAYLAELARAWERQGNRRALHAARKADAALKVFGQFLKALPPVCRVAADSGQTAAVLQETLTKQFLCPRPLQQILEIAHEEWQNCLDELERLQACIDPGRSWQRIYVEYQPPETAGTDLFTLYSREIGLLRQFFTGCGLAQDPTPLELRETPVFLRSVRGSGSFSAALGAGSHDKDFFYLTTHLPETPGEQRPEGLKKRLHREYRFLCAHETFPGHHLLDTIRRRLANPVRRQIESPLFY